MSATIKYVNGKISYIATRGDGYIGQDITHLSDYLNIPKTIDNKNVMVNGNIENCIIRHGNINQMAKIDKKTLIVE